MSTATARSIVRKGADERAGVFYFSEPPANADTKPKAKNYSDWSRWRQANYLFFKAVLDVWPRKSVLVDIGAGATPFRDLLRQFDYVGVDFYPFEDVTVVADFTVGLPLRDASADILFLSNTVEHIPDAAYLISECERVLKPGGIFVGTIPFLMRIHQAPYDFNRFTHHQLERLLGHFEEVHVEPLGAPFNAYRTLTRHFF